MMEVWRRNGALGDVPREEVREVYGGYVGGCEGA